MHRELSLCRHTVNGSPGDDSVSLQRLRIERPRNVAHWHGDARVQLDHVNVQFQASLCSRYERCWPGGSVDVERAVLGLPYVLDREAVIVKERSQGRQIFGENQHVQVVVLTGLLPKERIDSPAAHHPASDAALPKQFIEVRCSLRGQIHGPSLPGPEARTMRQSRARLSAAHGCSVPALKIRLRLATRWSTAFT